MRQPIRRSARVAVVGLACLTASCGISNATGCPARAHRNLSSDELIAIAVRDRSQPSWVEGGSSSPTGKLVRPTCCKTSIVDPGAFSRTFLPRDKQFKYRVSIKWHDVVGGKRWRHEYYVSLDRCGRVLDSSGWNEKEGGFNA
jgi:hypothetical protein